MLSFAPGLLALAAVNAPLVHAAQRALQPADGVRAEVVDAQAGLAPGCAITRARLLQRPVRSTVVSVDFEGRDGRGGVCRAQGWARVRVWGQVWVTTRAVSAGELLTDAVAPEEREVVSELEPLTTLSPTSRAARLLRRGTVIEPRHLASDGPAVGASVAVVVVVGGLRVEQQGVVLACPGRSCARLHSGRRVEGQLVDGKLEVTP